MRINAWGSLLVVAVLAAACSESSTAPSRGMSSTGSASASRGDMTAMDCSDPTNDCFSFGRGTPPPPFVDTMAVTVDESGALVGAAPVRVQYFMNKPGNNGWVKFKGQTAGVIASPNAEISFHQGSVSGKGTLQIPMPGSSTLVIDLSKDVSGKSVFNGDCSKTCGSIVLTGAQLFSKGSKVGTPFNGGLQLGIISPDIVVDGAGH